MNLMLLTALFAADAPASMPQFFVQRSVAEDISKLTAAVQANPNDLELKIALGNAQIAGQDNDGAMATLRAAEVLAAPQAKQHARVCAIEYAIGRVDDAINCWEAVTEKDKDPEL